MKPTAPHDGVYARIGPSRIHGVGVPPSLNMLSVGWYVNHADRPNVEAGHDGRFRALRRIRSGEELTADYRTFADEPLAFTPRRVRPRVPKR